MVIFFAICSYYLNCRVMTGIYATLLNHEVILGVMAE